MARIGIIGSEGRMGRALEQAITAAGHEISGGADKGADVAALADASEALVDFRPPRRSRPTCTRRWARESPS